MLRVIGLIYENHTMNFLESFRQWRARLGNALALPDVEDEADVRRAAQRLAAARRAAAKQRQAISRESQPPGQTPTREWPSMDLGILPEVPGGGWRLSVSGLVERPLALNMVKLKALGSTEVTRDMHCVTGWSHLAASWAGVSGRALAQAAGVRPGARFVIVISADGYSTNMPIERFLAEGVLLADTADGKPLSARRGGPLRLVVPDLYFWKSAKWITEIQFVSEDVRGYWECRGYHNDGDPWREQRWAVSESANSEAPEGL